MTPPPLEQVAAARNLINEALGLALGDEGCGRDYGARLPDYPQRLLLMTRVLNKAAGLLAWSLTDDERRTGVFEIPHA
jgi:hypothetical protein